MSREAAHRRQLLRRSNAAVPYRNRYRERQAGDDAEWLADAEAEIEEWEDNGPFRRASGAGV